MSGTKPTSEQLRFNSANTGDQSLDTYLEAAEIGGRALAALLGDIFDSSGNPMLSALQDWKGDWTTSTAYIQGDTFRDTVTNDIYVAVASHTSTSIAADVSSSYIEKVADFSTITAAAAASATSFMPTPRESSTSAFRSARSIAATTCC